MQSAFPVQRGKRVGTGSTARCQRKATRMNDDSKIGTGCTRIHCARGPLEAITARRLFLVRLLVVAACWLCAHSMPTRADWTAALPQGNWQTRNLHPSSEFGVTIVLVNEPASTNGVVWYSPEGTLKLSYFCPVAEWEIPGQVYILNRSQLLFVREYKPAISVATLTGDGKSTVRHFTFSSTQRFSYYRHGGSDFTGLYYVDSASNTLTRVDFPKPPDSTPSVFLQLQSATEAVGPWTLVSETLVPSELPQEYFRIEIAK